MDLLLLALGLLAGALVGLIAGLRLGGRDEGALAALSSSGEDRAVISEGLGRLDERLRDLERQRASWQGMLHQQVDEVRHSTDALRRETGALTTALRRPHVRGQWGELHLRRTVEAAGMSAHCDFTEQQHLAHADGVLRPDLVVHLAGARSVVVDAKTPLDAYLDALVAQEHGAEEDEVRALLGRHARQVRSHVDALSAKAYWSRLAQAPEFVVLFVPSESCLAAALEADPSLIEYAARRQVVLASPTTLIALLRTVAHGWTTVQLAEATREIHDLGRALHERLGTMGGHLDKLGRSLGASVEAYNRAVGSLEARVLVTARQFSELDDTAARLPTPAPVETAPRPLSAAELLEAVAEPRPELVEHRPEGGTDGGYAAGHG
ncbi:MAG: DNA recombination protein RmuC [Marmoricola sp.]